MFPVSPSTPADCCCASVCVCACVCLLPAAVYVSAAVCCLLHAPGFKALCEAFTSVTGDCKPYSITGSLPCIRDLQEAGFDVQTLGFGKLAAYHSNNGEGRTRGGDEEEGSGRGTHAQNVSVRHLSP